MLELLAALDAFLQEHRCCGDLDGGVDDGRVWMACGCGATVTHRLPELGADLKAWGDNQCCT
jgi:hypothetical protein